MSHLEKAIPLVLPNNCTWNPNTGAYNKKPGVQRTKLEHQERTLDELRKVKGPVCVVAVTGPCRNGKSFILGEIFGHSEVFALGHTMKSETMGIWMWILPEKFTDNNGGEFTIVLLDSEGIDSTESDVSNDHRIFTLSTLLSSTLLYNSTGVPKMKDLNDLDCVVHLSQRIQLLAGKKNADDEIHRASEVLPFFVWLLRDVFLGIPDGHATLKDYFLKEVLNTNNESQSDNARKAADNIIGYFSGFDAIDFPIPSDDKTVIQNMTDPSVKDKIKPEFLRTIQRFRTQILDSLLRPKRSTNKGEWVTGEGLAAMVQQFVETLNSPGGVPNFQNTWDTFVLTKCTESVKEATDMYKEEIKSRVQHKIPCDAIELRSANEEVIKRCMDMFQTKTMALSAKSIKSSQEELEGRIASIFEKWIEENRRKTTIGCKNLLKQLRKDILQPVFARLRSPDVDKMEFKDVIEAYDKMQEKYKRDARGANDAIAEVYNEFLPEFRKEMKQNIEVLTRMKDYNKDIANQKAIAAAKEEVVHKNEERIARLEDQLKAKTREFKLLNDKREADNKKINEELDRNLKEHDDQIENMRKAHKDEMIKSREGYTKAQKSLESKIQQISDVLKKKNEEIKNLTDLIKKERDKSIGQLLNELCTKIMENCFVS